MAAGHCLFTKILFVHFTLSRASMNPHFFFLLFQSRFCFHDDLLGAGLSSAFLHIRLPLPSQHATSLGQKGTARKSLMYFKILMKFRTSSRNCQSIHLLIACLLCVTLSTHAAPAAQLASHTTDRVYDHTVATSIIASAREHGLPDLSSNAFWLTTTDV